MLTKLQKKLAEIRENEERGMSLTELVVVVAILAILVAIAVPVYLSIQDDAKDQSVKTTLANALTVHQYETARPGGTPEARVNALATSEMSVTWGAACITANIDAGSTWSVATASGNYFENATCTP